MESKYCYPQTNVLINKLDIREEQKLFEIERIITAARSAELLETPVKGNFDLKHLQAIHQKLFGDLYPFAGKIRDVRIAKGNMFCYPEFIVPMADKIFGSLAKESFLRARNHDVFIERLAFYIGEINALHPFRDGNGRTQRIYFSQLAKQAGYELSFEAVEQESLLQADIAAMKGNYAPLVTLLQKAVFPLNI